MDNCNERDVFSPALSELWAATRKFPQARWDEALSKGQISSKLWLAKVVDRIFSGRHFDCVYVLAGWYGVLSRILLDDCRQVSFGKIRSFDMDPSCEPIADSVNRKWIMEDWKFKAATGDVTKINYERHNYHVINSRGETVGLSETPDMIINTSCEHFDNFEGWYELIPPGRRIVLQSNNDFEQAEHKNCVRSIEELKSSAPMSDVLFEGELKLQNYSRFMLIGQK